MEQTPPTRPVSAGKAPDGRPPPRGGNPVERIAENAKGLLEDVKAWVDLRIELIKLEVAEEIDARKKDVAVGVVVGLLALLALVFGLIAAALGLGAWLGHPAWGFLVMTALLVMTAVVLWSLHVSRKKRARPPEKEEPSQLEEHPRDLLPAPSDV